MPLYARTGIVEIWLVNIPKEIVEVYSESQNGKYRKCQKVQSR